MFTHAKTRLVTQSGVYTDQKNQNHVGELRYAFEGMHPDAYMDAIENDINELKHLRTTLLRDGMVSSQLSQYLLENSPGIQMALRTLCAAEKDTPLSQETLAGIADEIDGLTASIQNDILNKTPAYIAHAIFELDNHTNNANEALGYKSAKNLVVGTKKLIEISKKASLIAVGAGVFAEIFVSEKAYTQREMVNFINALKNTEDVISSLASLSSKEHLDEDVVEKTIKPAKALGIYVEGNSSIRHVNDILSSTKTRARSLRSIGYTKENLKSMAKDLGPVASNQDKIVTASKDAIKEIEKNDGLSKEAMQRGVRNIKTVTDRYLYTLKQVKKQMEYVWDEMSSYQDSLKIDEE